MRKRKAHEPSHVWQRRMHRVEVRGVSQEAKSCARCGMERTRDMDTKTLYLFREIGTDRWQGFTAGFLPACERPNRT